MTGRARAIAIAGTFALVAGCSRGDDAKPRSVSLDPAAARTAYLDGSVALAPAATNQNTRPDPAWSRDPDASQGQMFQVWATKTVFVEAGAAKGGAPAKVNPDDAILERTRVAAGGCFRALPGYVARRSAHIALTVVPTGTVSRADVTSPDTTDDGVLGCIQQEALGAHFSDNADGPLRTYAIDVQVVAK